MALLNPVYGLIVPFLFVVTIPLAILAGITTTLAFSVLMFRVAVVYIDIAVNMVPQYVTGHRIYPFPARGYAPSLITGAATASGIPQSHQPPPIDTRVGSGQTTPSPVSRASMRHHRRARTSTTSFASAGSLTPIEDKANSGARRDSFVMIPSIGMDRDFEGVGGWRLDGKDADDDDAWTQLNSRLELPHDPQRRHHHRSPSGGGATTPGGAGDYLVMKSPRAARSKDGSPENGGARRDRERRQQGNGMSPNSSRQRTPTNGLAPVPPPLTTMDRADESYFPPLSPKIARRTA